MANQPPSGIPTANLTKTRRFDDGTYAYVLFAGFRALGDFLNCLCFLSYTKRIVRRITPVFVAHNDRPYKMPLVQMSRDMGTNLMLPPDHPMPLEWFDYAGQNPMRGPEQIYDTILPFAETIVAPFQISKAMQMAALPYVRAFDIPESHAPDKKAKLVAMGLDPDRWFVCIFAREDSYKFRAGINDGRNVDSQKYYDLACHIIDDLGGQVVRIGHSALQPWQRDGVVDLKDTEDDFMVQAMAMKHARFMMGSNSGPPCVASALGTPVAFIDDTLPHTGLNPWCCSLTKHIIPKVDDTEGLREKFFAKDWAPHPEVAEITDNSLDEIKAMAGFMMEKTEACRGWRDHWAPEPDYEVSDQLSLPLAPVEQASTYFGTPWWDRL